MKSVFLEDEKKLKLLDKEVVVIMYFKIPNIPYLSIYVHILYMVCFWRLYCFS